MALPSNADLEWPPPYLAKYTRQQAEWAAWWAGDVDLLRNHSAPRRFWARQAEQDRRKPPHDRGQTRSMHAALAADIVATSADLLFGEPVGLTIPPPEATGDAGEHVDAGEDGVDQGDASLNQEAAAVQVTQARLDELRELLALDLLLLEAAEVAAALGGAWLRPAWDTALADHPIATVVDPGSAVPEYRMRQLTAVTFWEVVVDDADAGGRVWRHLERHETRINPATGERVGVILHGLYEGDRDKLGTRHDLGKQAATAGLVDEVAVPAAAGPLLPRYMPNVLPNRKYRRLPIGRSDFDGAEDTLDSLDETWSSLLRDIRLGVARLLVPENTLQRAGTGAGTGRMFDVDREIMVEMDIAADDQGAKVALVQGQIRDASHLATVDALTRGAVSAAGYSPQTFGLDIDGAAESGTALNVRERKTWRTLRRKRGYAGTPVAGFAHALLAIDADVFGQAIVPMRPKVDWPDVTQDAEQTANRLQLLRAAQAISIRNAVREAQPGLTEAEVEDEVARIMGESAVADPETVGADQPGQLDDPGAVQ